MIKHVIVQAGGKGTRMGSLTYNRPKCLISIDGTTLLQSISKAFPDATLHIIGDYKFEMLQSYLRYVDLGFVYTLTKTDNNGTMAGIYKALEFVPENEPFAITWSDLYYATTIQIRELNRNYIILTNSNKCRYKYENSLFIQQDTVRNGVVGLFVFSSKKFLEDIPISGEFVKYLSQKNFTLQPIFEDHIFEIGTREIFEEFKSKTFNSRFFNKLEINGDIITKQPRSKYVNQLIEREGEWYKYMNEHGYNAIPEIIEYRPLRMKRVIGLHPFQFQNNISKERRNDIIHRICEELKKMHAISKIPANRETLHDVYVTKTINRILPVTQILKLDNKKVYRVNGKKVEIITPERIDLIERIFDKIKTMEYFYTIHGDPTFSNILIGYDNSVKFIDPRGYFGNLKVFGDYRYDFAKLFYSAIGNYDQFNSQRFVLKMDGPDISLKLSSSGFESTYEVFSRENRIEMTEIELLHALIWLSLSGYVLNDVDSMIASYFNGLKLLKEADETYGIL